MMMKKFFRPAPAAAPTTVTSNVASAGKTPAVANETPAKTAAMKKADSTDAHADS